MAAPVVSRLAAQQRPQHLEGRTDQLLGERTRPRLRRVLDQVARDLRSGRDDGVEEPTAPGRFERREVQVGQVTDEWVEVLHGVAPGEEVVTIGAFLLRSQASADELGGHHH